MKSFFLLLKNNWKNITKLKGVFVLLLFIIMLFSATLTFFWEFKRQYNLNIEKSKIKDAQYDFINRSSKKLTPRNVFCTDFTELNNATNKTQRRFPTISFNNKNGCFRKINFKDLMINFLFSKEKILVPNSKSKRRRILKIKNLEIPINSFIFNRFSKYYQNSIHGRLMKKFRLTGDLKYLAYARWLKKAFLPSLKRQVELRIKAFLNKKLLKNHVFVEEKNVTSSIWEFIKKSGLPSYEYPFDFTRRFISPQSNQSYSTMTDFYKEYLKSLKRKKELVQKMDSDTISEIFNFLFGKLINQIKIWNQKALLTNENNNLKIPIVLTQVSEQFFTNSKIFVANSEKEQVVNFDNYQNIIAFINKILTADQAFFAKHKQKKDSFVRWIKLLLNRSKEIVISLRQILNVKHPLFTVFSELYDVKNEIPSNLTRQQQLQNFNFEGQTLLETYDSIFSIKKTKSSWLLRKIQNFKTNRFNNKKNAFFESNIANLRLLEKELFGDNKLSYAITRTTDFDKKILLITNFFYGIEEKIQNLKNLLLSIRNFIGFNEKDIESITFEFLLANSIFLTDNLANIKVDNYLQQIKKLKNLKNKLLHRIKQIEWIKALTNNEDLKIVKLINDVTNLTALNVVRNDKWQVVQNWLFLVFADKFANIDPAKDKLPTLQAIFEETISNTPSLKLSKFLEYYYKGLENLDDVEYQQFNTDWKLLKTATIERETKLALKKARMLEQQRKNTETKIELKTPDRNYSSSTKEFIRSFENYPTQTNVQKRFFNDVFWTFMTGGEYDTEELLLEAIKAALIETINADGDASTSAEKENMAEFVKSPNASAVIKQWIENNSNLVQLIVSADNKHRLAKITSANQTSKTIPWKFADIFREQPGFLLAYLNGLIYPSGLFKTFNKKYDAKLNYYQIFYKQQLFIWNSLRDFSKSWYGQSPLTGKIETTNNELNPDLVSHLEKTKKVVQELQAFANPTGGQHSIINIYLNTKESIDINYIDFLLPPILEKWLNQNLNSEFNLKEIVITATNQKTFLNQLLSDKNFEFRQNSLRFLSSTLAETKFLVPNNIAIPFIRMKNFWKIKTKLFYSLLKKEINDPQVKFNVTPRRKPTLFPYVFSKFSFYLYDPIPPIDQKVKNPQKDFFTDNYFISFKTEQTRNIEKILVKVQNTFFTQIKNNPKNKNYFFHVKNWKTDNFWQSAFFNIMPNPGTIRNRDPVNFYHQLAQDRYIRIVSELNDVKFESFRSIYFQNSRKNENYLFVARNQDTNFYLESGFLPKNKNQVVISPLFARKNKIKIGDKISMINLFNLEVTGIGTTKRFVFPALSYLNLIPRPKDNIVFLNQYLLEEIEQTLKKTLNPEFWVSNDYFFFTGQKGKNFVKNYENLFGILGINTQFLFSKNQGSSNYTFFSKAIFPRYKSKYAKYHVTDHGFLWAGTAKTLIPFDINSQLPIIIYKILLWAFIYIMIILALITTFAIWHLLSKMIEINQNQIGVLKAVGYNDGFILGSFLIFGLFYNLSIFLGWLLGTILQKPLFDLLLEKFLFKFDMLYYNFHSFFVILGLIFTFIVIILLAFNFLKFKHMTPLVILQGGNNLSNKTGLIDRFLIFFKHFIISPFWKINYVLFTTIARKVALLFIVIFFITVNLLLITFFTTTFSETEKKIFAQQKTPWEIEYKSPIVGHPLSRFNFYTNFGQDAIISAPDGSITPTENLSGEVYLYENGEYKQKKLQISEILAMFYILQGKTLNYNKINNLLTGNKAASAKLTKVEQEKFNRGVCSIFQRLFENNKVDDVNCLENIIDKTIPFVSSANQAKVKKHFPISFSNVLYNPQKDELFTRLQGSTGNKPAFVVLGLQKRSRNLPLASAVKQTILEEDHTDKIVIPVAINRHFADKMKIKLNQKFKMQVNIEQMFFKTAGGIETKLTNQNWNYSFYDQTGQLQEVPVTDLPYNWQFYKGEAFAKTSAKSKYRILTDPITNIKKIEIRDSASAAWTEFRPHYKVLRLGKPEFKQYINVDNISLNVNGKIYWPFRWEKKDKDSLNPKTHMFNWIKNGRFFSLTQIKQLTNRKNQAYEFQPIAIVESYDKSRLFISQSFINNAIGWKSLETQTYANLSYLNPDQYFNARFSASNRINQALFNFGMTNSNGFLDLLTVGVGRTPTTKGFQNLNLVAKYQTAFLEFIFNIIAILVVINILTSFFLFGLVIKIIFDIFRKKTVLLKTLGYNNFELMTQILLVTFLPFLLAFLMGALLSKYLFDTLVSYLATKIQFYFFYNSSFWIFLICFGILLLLFSVIYNFFRIKIKRSTFKNFAD